MAYINEGTIAFLKSIQKSLNSKYPKKKNQTKINNKVKTFKIKKGR